MRCYILLSQQSIVVSAEVSIAEFQGPDLSLPPTQVAVKRLKDHSMKSEGDVLDFIEEVRVLHRLNHP